MPHISTTDGTPSKLELHFKERKFDHKYWEDLRHHHFRVGVDAFWRLACRHKGIDKLLEALRKERAWRGDWRDDRVDRVRARNGMWDLLAESRFEAYVKERRFDRRHWESLRHYYELVGADAFWRVARDCNEIEKLRSGLSGELRRRLLDDVKPVEMARGKG